MERPASVPDDAVWDPSDREWVSAEVDDEGRKHGLARYFRADGTLCCETEFVADTPHGRFQRFHENGEVSREGRFEEGQLSGVDAFVRCAEPTTEKFPDGVPAQAWRCEMIYDGGRVVGGRLFDEDGEVIARHGVAAEDDEEASDDEEPDEEEESSSGPPPRPESVPASATWDEEQGRWQAGALSAREERDGEWLAWDAEGRVRGRTRYADDWPLELERFFEDGAVAAHERYQPGGVPIARTMKRAADGSGLPEDIPNEVLTVEYTYDAHGYMTGFKFLGEGDELVEETKLYNDASNRIEQTRFTSLGDASRAWRDKGTKFFRGLNAWLDVIYKEGRENEEPEPSDERGDMERVIIEALEHANKNGKHAELRKLFPPAVEPFGPAFFGKYGRDVRAIVPLSHDALSVLVDDELYFIDGATVTKESGVLMSGASADGRWFGLAFPDRVEIRGEWNGPAIVKLTYPRAYDEALQKKHPVDTPCLRDARRMGIAALQVFPDGKRVLLVSREGTYVLSASGAQRLFPTAQHLAQYFEDAGDRLVLGVRYPNAAVDPRGRYVTVGGMLSRGIFADLLVYEIGPTSLTLKASSGDQAFFPRNASFHPKHPALAYAAALYATFSNMGGSLANTTFRIGYEQLDQGGSIESFAGGVHSSPGLVESIVPFGDGFLLGMGNGYVWHMSAVEDMKQLGYIHLGGAIGALAFSPDGRYLYAGSSTGMLFRLALNAKRDPNLITDMPVTDVQRWLFWKTFPPMLW